MQSNAIVFWWVNQNQTHRQEVGGGYMWSPKLNSDGGYNHFYNNYAKQNNLRQRVKRVRR